MITLPTKLDLPIIPEFDASAQDPFLQQVQRSGHKWVVLVDKHENPLLVLDADGFLRAALFGTEGTWQAYDFCHRPIIVHDPLMPLGDVIGKFKTGHDPTSDQVIDHDIILLWGDQRRIITGADILGRLFKGIHLEGK